MPWGPATFPEAPRGELTLDLVDDALLTRVEKGPLRTLHQPRLWLRGAVHDRDGRLLVASQKIGGLAGNQLAAADPERVTPARDLEVLPGTWLYGGHWMQHFGHFIIESLSTLWPEGQQVDGIVFHRYLARKARVEPWQQWLVGLTGYGGLPIRVVGNRAVRVQRLVLPGRAVVANGWVWPEGAALWRRMAAALDRPARGDRVFLSRSRFNANQAATGVAVRTSPERDRELDETFAAGGFRVAYPEELPLDEQLELTAGAEVIAGMTGSALHLSVFAEPRARVIEVGDSRWSDRPNPMQEALNAACGHEQLFIPAGETAAQISTTLATLEETPQS